MTVPVYITELEGSDNTVHLCVGDEPKTLCGESSIIVAVQIGDVDKFSDTICDECLKEFELITEEIEPVIDCDRCEMNILNKAYPTKTGITKARMVNRDEKRVPVCELCYIELYRDSNSNVDIPYENAEPFI